MGNESSLFASQPVDRLARLYIEPTNRCNLDCRTCMRQEWDTTPGIMSRRVFMRIIEGVRQFPSIPTFFFGGYGEPLSHPDIVFMVRQAKTLPARVELITNGILLQDDLARQLTDAGLDFLWVSLDGATPESYADVRLGAALPQVLENLRRFYSDRILNYRLRPELGISFVAMKRNIVDLLPVIELGTKLGAVRFIVSNIEAYTADMQDEILYAAALGDPSCRYHVSMPRMGGDHETATAIQKLISRYGWAGPLGSDFTEPLNICPFVEKGSTSIRWDGKVSPCLPLLYTHTIYLKIRVHRQEEHSLGSLLDRDLRVIWEDPSYTELRRRLLDFAFAPCLACNGCELLDLNGEDCFGNTHPACGGCLWAYGFIQCP